MATDATIMREKDGGTRPSASSARCDQARPALPACMPYVAGLILLCSAVLKVWQMIQSPVLPPSPLGITRFDFVLIGVEIFLGLWLFSGAFAGTARLAAILCFAIFGLYTLYEAVSGRANCGCFGHPRTIGFHHQCPPEIIQDRCCIPRNIGQQSQVVYNHTGSDRVKKRNSDPCRRRCGGNEFALVEVIALRCRVAALQGLFLFRRCFMYKLLFIGLVSAGLLSLGLSVPVQAMKSASDADLRACSGMWIAGVSCTDLGTACTGTDPATNQCSVTGAVAGDACNFDVSTVDNYGCKTPALGILCKNGTNACVSWSIGTCELQNGALICNENSPSPGPGSGTAIGCVDMAQ